MAGAEVAAQDLADESLGRALGEREVEVQDDHVVDPDRLQRPGLDPQGSQAKGRQVRLEDLAGMRLEGHHPERYVQLGRLGASDIDDRLVAAMHTVEVADGGHRAARLRRQTLALPVDRHGVSAN